MCTTEPSAASASHPTVIPGSTAPARLRPGPSLAAVASVVIVCRLPRSEASSQPRPGPPRSGPDGSRRTDLRPCLHPVSRVAVTGTGSRNACRRALEFGTDAAVLMTAGPRRWYRPVVRVRHDGTWDRGERDDDQGVPARRPRGGP